MDESQGLEGAGSHSSPDLPHIDRRTDVGENLVELEACIIVDLALSSC